MPSDPLESVTAWLAERSALNYPIYESVRALVSECKRLRGVVEVAEKALREIEGSTIDHVAVAIARAALSQIDAAKEKEEANAK